MSVLITYFTVVFSVAITLVVAVLVLQQRRTPQSTAAWLIFIMVLPYLAIPLFFALGFRKQRARFHPIAFSPPPQTPPQTSGPHTELGEVFRRFGLPPAAPGNDFSLLADGCDSWAQALAIVRSARDTLDITFYRIADDAVGRAFVEQLSERAAAGVRVRLIIDGLGGFVRPSAQLRAFKRAGGTLRDFSPLLHRPGSRHLNLRNHRKMILADGARVFSGGRNIGLEYLGPDPNANRWVDLSFTLNGPATAPFADVFRADWAATGAGDTCAAHATHFGGATTAQLVPSGPDIADDSLHDGLVHAIHCAQTRVWIATPYFLPTEPLENALSMAARRGVDVQMLVPNRSDQRIADIACGAYLRGLQKAGCTILRYRPGMMHAKAAVIDDVACVGSANFDVRSMLLNFELMLFVHDSATVAQLAGWYSGAAAHCDTGITAARLPRRVVEGLFRLGAPML